MGRPLTQVALDRFQCDDPDCEADHGALTLMARCHPGAGLDVSYCKMHGVLTCRCTVCGDAIVEIAVAASHGSALSCRHQ